MLSAPVFRISGIQDVMPGPSISAGRGQGAKDLRGISPITGKGNGQGGSHVQRKYPGIDFHRARILMPGQCLDDLPGLPVIKHVHDIGIEKCTPSASARFTACFSQLRIVSSVTGHNGSRRRGRVVTIQLSI